MTKTHPNLISNYFEEINTKEKAYWLGFLYADGCIIKLKNNIKIVSFGLHKKEKIILEKFIKSLNGNKEKIAKNGKNFLYIRFYDQKMFDDLMKWGCVQRKSNIIELPDLLEEKYNLAFLLGYYDGDGTVNSTRITTGSRKFLEQIKKKYQLPFKITFETSEIQIKGRKKYIGKKYVMCIGGELFNKMMDNYQESLPRKRKYYCLKDERIKRIKENVWNKGQKIKFNITKEILEKLVWEKTAVQIAKEYNVSDSLISKKCKQWNIKKPSRGYWSSKKI